MKFNTSFINISSLMNIFISSEKKLAMVQEQEAIKQQKQAVIEKQEKKEKIIKNFYNQFKLSLNENALYDIVQEYIKAGFKIEDSHKRIIGCDPFLMVFKNTSLEVREYANEIKNNNCKILELLWDRGIEENYKKIVMQGKIILDDAFKADAATSYDIKNNFYKTFKSFQLVEFFLNKIFMPIENDFSKERLQIGKLTKYFNQYEILYKKEIKIMDVFSNKLNENYTLKLTSELTGIFNKTTTLKLAQGGQAEENITLMNIKMLRFYEEKLIGSEKMLLNDTLNNIQELYQSSYFKNNSEDYFYAENLVAKHLPNLIEDYLEIPARIRDKFKDDNGCTPTDIFCETLSAMNEKIKKISENVFENNFKKLKITHRVNVM